MKNYALVIDRERGWSEIRGGIAGTGRAVDITKLNPPLRYGQSMLDWAKKNGLTIIYK